MPTPAIDQCAPPFGAEGAIQASATAEPGRWLDLSCRLLDVFGAAVMLIVLAPLLAVIAIVIKLDSAGPVLYRQRRLGHRAEPFTVNKFRTMYDGVAPDHHRDFVLALIDGE